MKAREMSILILLAGLLVTRLLQNPLCATLAYIAFSYLFRLDSNITPEKNTHAQKEGIFVHKFTTISKTYSGAPVNITYHSVECGKGEAIVFFHGLAENWRVWKDIMTPFCDKYRAIAVDIEGMGQSPWPSIETDLPAGGDAREFMGDMELQLLDQLGLTRFNLVVTDYGFWSTLSMLSKKDKGNKSKVLRYLKLQSTVGVEDPARLPQAVLFRNARKTVAGLMNSNPYALTRVLFGKPLIKLPGLVKNSRAGPNGISDEDFDTRILPAIPEGLFTSWSWFYSKGKDGICQMEYQLDVFKNADFPVFMLQGDSDLGQPNYLFDGSSKMEIVEEPMSSFRDRFVRMNVTHKIKVTRGEQSGIYPGPEKFFPKSPFVKFKFLKDVGHFVHLEAPQETVHALKELLAVKSK